MNSGLKNQQLSACYVLPIKDSIDEIFDTLRHAMRIQKTGGGTGFSFSNLRPRSSIVKSSKGMASGPVSFLRVYNMATDVIKEGGKRRGANMGVLRVDHPDILEFINCKSREESIRNFNISVSVTNDFIKRVLKDKEYNIKDPITNEKIRRLNARYVFDSLITAAWNNGDPGILFLDRINRDNPTPSLGKIESTNPCGELPLLDYEACNLGSINLGNFVIGKNIQWKRLREVVHLGVHFLDNVIDMCNFPAEEIKRITRGNRKIGLGIMGFADMLVKLRVSYNSNKGIKAAEQVIKFIRREADKESIKLAKERGIFPNWKESIYNKKSIYFRGKHMRLRNATRLSIAPTGSLSMIADCSPGIEPLFALAYVKKVLGDREFYYVDRNFKEALDERNLNSEAIIENVVNLGSVQHVEDVPKDIRRIFAVAHDISPEWHIKIQAAFQKYVDNAISKTVNFPNNVTIKDVERVYLLAWKLGCKGITTYRDRSKKHQIYDLRVEFKTKKFD